MIITSEFEGHTTIEKYKRKKIVERLSNIKGIIDVYFMLYKDKQKLVIDIDENILNNPNVIFDLGLLVQAIIDY